MTRPMVLDVLSKNTVSLNNSLQKEGTNTGLVRYSHANWAANAMTSESHRCCPHGENCQICLWDEDLRSRGKRELNDGQEMISVQETICNLEYPQIIE